MLNPIAVFAENMDACKVQTLDSSHEKIEVTQSQKIGNDFEFSAEFRTSKSATGEVVINFENGNFYKILINNDYQNNAWWRMTGSLASVRNIVKDMARDGEWFSLKIILSGALIEVFVNGVKMVEYIEPKSPFRNAQNAKMLLGENPKIEIAKTGGEKIEVRKVSLVYKTSRTDIANQKESAIDETKDAVIRLHQMDFPVLDYHVHLKGGLTFDWALARSRKLGINYAIAPNCGRDFQINQPQFAEDFLKDVQNQPFLICMQAEGREWHKIFPKSIWDKFDFVFTDAMTFDDAKGNRTHVWKAHEVKCAQGEEEAYMEWIVNTICSVVNEPSDIYANPLWLPEILRKDYDKYWTKSRKERVLEALVKAKKPMEINTYLRIPDEEFIEMAHSANCKFTFGTNNINPEFTPFGETDIKFEHGKFDKILRLVEKLKLTANDIYAPRRRICK